MRVTLQKFYNYYYSFLQIPKVSSQGTAHGIHGCIRCGKTETQDFETVGPVRLSFFFFSVSLLPHHSSSNGNKIIIKKTIETLSVWKEWNCVLSLFEGGQVTFDLKNDGPTLTGARASFSINLNFPPNQTVLPDGQVVWAQNCTVNGMFFNLQAIYKHCFFFFFFYFKPQKYLK